MYFPYLRGKQNELILLRENAELIANSPIIPIIEPVKSNLKPLLKATESLMSAGSEFILITNSICGDFSGDSSSLIDGVLTDETLSYKGLNLGYILDENSSIRDVVDFVNKYSTSNIALIHFGYSNGAELSAATKSLSNIKYNVFIERHAQRRYRSRFDTKATQVLIRDGFIKRSNREHPSSEPFSELHIMFKFEGAQAFGDFLIAGEEFSESGGPAYAVAIHLTYLDKKSEDDMYINHYVSNSNSSPADPGGKFMEALNKLVADLEFNKNIFPSQAISEFTKLHTRKHFPGLGVVKKLSMQHHVELMADYLKDS
jgi:hypothetical protein